MGKTICRTILTIIISAYGVAPSDVKILAGTMKEMRVPYVCGAWVVNSADDI